ncbi:hypothetical protein [Aquimarina longa]|uniref:hypothetical protein n=1 Tax=Aquimarina longa TaxID=1080221 RepID=UPI00078626D7|nr:hypothetical protein [Aquimarina longa]
MKSILYFFSLFLALSTYANGIDDSLEVEKEGLVVVVVNFQDGDKIKLFEVESGDHVLSKTRGEVDLSFLPVGAYLLENSEGESVIIERLEEDINITEALDNDFVIENDSERMYMPAEINIEKEYIHYYDNAETNLLSITREGNFITVDDFEEGDKIKLFEVKNTVHVLSKTTNVVDLSQLPVGVYVLENNKGKSVVIEKLEEDNTQYSEIVE